MTFIEFISTYWLSLISIIVLGTIRYFAGIGLQKKYDLYNWWFCMIWGCFGIACGILVFYAFNGFALC